MMIMVAILLSAVVASELTHSVAFGELARHLNELKRRRRLSSPSRKPDINEGHSFLWLRSVSNVERLLIFVLFYAVTESYLILLCNYF